MNDPEKKPEDTASTVIPGSSPAGLAAVVQTTSVVTETAASSQENPPKGTPGRWVPLKHPFKSGDGSLSKVVFSRRPKAKDLIQTYGTNSPLEQELHGIAALLGVVPEDLAEMDGADYLAVQREYAAFLD